MTSAVAVLLKFVNYYCLNVFLGEAPKQTKLPTEISTSVDTFKEFVKKQKAISSEIMRISIKPFHKVSS